MFFLDAECGGLLNVVIVIRKVINVLQILIPIALILFGLIDLGKAVIAGKEDEMKKAQGTLLRRVVYAVAVFFVFTLVTFAMGLIGKGDPNSEWRKCWEAAENGNVELD